jgi:hypothetical protein
LLLLLLLQHSNAARIEARLLLLLLLLHHSLLPGPLLPHGLLRHMLAHAAERPRTTAWPTRCLRARRLGCCCCCCRGSGHRRRHRLLGLLLLLLPWLLFASLWLCRAGRLGLRNTLLLFVMSLRASI